MKKIIVLLLFVLGLSVSYSQDQSKKSFTLSGYAEAYYSYDFGQPQRHNRPNFMYNYHKNNELNLNLGMLKLGYAKETVRANVALMAGTYTQANMAAEPDIFRPIYEANFGVKVSKKQQLWIDFGVFPSHIGFESAIGKDCQTLTRSILADNSPYFETGVKLSYVSQSGKWNWAMMYLNGWQRIQRVQGNKTPAFGSQLQYKPNNTTTYNWSTYVGNEQPNGIEKWRFFNNFYGQFTFSEMFNMTAGFDIGVQQNSPNGSLKDTWFSPILIFQYKPTTNLQLAVRGEYYQDNNGVIIASTSPNGFKTVGISTNLDYKVAPNVLFRIEARNFSSNHEVFPTQNLASTAATFLTTAVAYSF